MERVIESDDGEDGRIWIIFYLSRLRQKSDEIMVIENAIENGSCFSKGRVDIKLMMKDDRKKGIINENCGMVEEERRR